ncbi:hypothetical protein FA15DRAFT_670011 [Coprinopsis marcescibilis]|uniref:Uncharacterized protein n=1 Tax=Coprinopsis marcescibilis TaxID=230819 RepID=A0A5C3KU18_COPMA|nr:hypothetical protein FA15DRAFT_670011 [Coprinopsis marcescibilis]
MAKKKKASSPALVKQAQSPQSPTNAARPPKPTIVIPPTPSPTNGPSSGDRIVSPETGLWSPPMSPRLPQPRKLQLPSISDLWTAQSEDLKPKAEAIASPEILAIAEFQSTIKQALANLSNTLGHLEVQSDRMQQMSSDGKIREELALLKSEIEEQIARQQEELDTVHQLLVEKVRTALKDHVKTQLHAMVNDSISRVVEERVRAELNTQIPEALRQGLLGHKRQIQEVKTGIHNSEARRYNSSLQSASLSVPLRPLLRPLPTPEQSPYPIIVTTAVDESRLSSAFPLSEFPHAPAPTPIKRSVSAFASLGAISRSHSIQPMSPGPSALFPKDLKSLFALGPDATRTLLREYGLESAAPSPSIEESGSIARLRAPKLGRRVSSKGTEPAIPEESDSEDENVEVHVQDMNTFMAHIGVPFLMVPPPKQRETNAERRKKLAPLIINTTLGPIR